MGIIDIGSNSVRLVVYEGLSRSPTPVFNEKILCGLGSQLATTGRLDDEAVERALAALRRFKMLAKQSGADDVYTLATAAAREAENGPDFVRDAEEILQKEIHVLTGAEEAHFASLGIVCGFENPKGISADMGGGSVEFIPLDGVPVGEGVTLPLGGLRLKELSDGSVKKAREIVRQSLASNTKMLANAKGQIFYAVGGTWRAIGRLHQARYGYPLSIMHNYRLTNEQAKKICKRMMQADSAKARGLNAVSSSRRDLIPFGAALLYEILKIMEPTEILISGVGVREGYLYSLLPDKVKKADPLITAAEEMAVLRSRSPVHSRELVRWTSAAFKVFSVKETKGEKRYRKAACLLSDVVWRSHPDYRGDQALNLLSNANFLGVDHPGRAFIALASYYRHEGLGSNDNLPPLAQLTPQQLAHKARLTGALFRVAFLMSAAMPGVLPKIRFEAVNDETVLITVPPSLADFKGERLTRRLEGLGEVVGKNVVWQVREEI